VFSGVSNAHPTFNNTTISLSLKTNITILKKRHIILPPISLTLKPEQLYHPQNLYIFILNQYHGGHAIELGKSQQHQTTSPYTAGWVGRSYAKTLGKVDKHL